MIFEQEVLIFEQEVMIVCVFHEINSISSDFDKILRRFLQMTRRIRMQSLEAVALQKIVFSVFFHEIKSISSDFDKILRRFL